MHKITSSSNGINVRREHQYQQFYSIFICLIYSIEQIHSINLIEWNHSTYPKEQIHSIYLIDWIYLINQANSICQSIRLMSCLTEQICQIDLHMYLIHVLHLLICPIKRFYVFQLLNKWMSLINYSIYLIDWMHHLIK